MRKPVLLFSSVVMALLLACGAVLVAAPQPAQAAFPGANGDIAFRSDRGADGPQVYRMKSDGTGVRKVSTGRYVIGNPAWSPDGNRLAWTKDTCVDNGGYCFTTYVANADGSGARAAGACNSRFAPSDLFPAWYPSGRKIVVSADDGHGRYDLCAVSLKDGSSTWLTSSSSQDEYDPAVSPDGKRIAFARDTVSGDTELFAMKANAPAGPDNRPIQLTNNRANERDPDWSPDGSKIVFSSTRGGDDEIFVINADGTRLHRLTRNQADDSYPVWSPDGNMIAFSRYSASDGDWEIWKMRANGHGKVRLMRNSAQDIEPDWQPRP